jgi:hypothetical protein
LPLWYVWTKKNLATLIKTDHEVSRDKVPNFHTRKFLKKHLSLKNSFQTGANPTIASYNASVVKIYNASSSLVRFKTKIFSSK